MSEYPIELKILCPTCERETALSHLKYLEITNEDDEILKNDNDLVFPEMTKGFYEVVRNALPERFSSITKSAPVITKTVARMKSHRISPLKAKCNLSDKLFEVITYFFVDHENKTAGMTFRLTKELLEGKERTFWQIGEDEKESFIKTSNVYLWKYPIFEDMEQVKQYCKILETHGIKTSYLRTKFTDYLIQEWRDNNIIFIEKGDTSTDMKCWSCRQLISHKDVNWQPRKVGSLDGDPVITDMMREAEKKMGNKEAIATPNEVFGYSEYEYRGTCTSCGVVLTCFWFGLDSMRKNKKLLEIKKPFVCHECKTPICKEFQVWYSRITMADEEPNEQTKEWLITICPRCKVENGYPSEYDLERGIIE